MRGPNRALPLLLLLCLCSLALSAAPLRLATFECDATPPPGDTLVWTTKLLSVEEPLRVKGVVLEDGTNRFVLCAIDWCLVGNDSERIFRETLARAAGTIPNRVAFQSLHQHAAPYADEGAFKLLESAPTPPPHLSTDFLSSFRARLVSAVAESTKRLEPFNEVGTGTARVERVASTRRLPGTNGSILVRFSTTRPGSALAHAPEGPIDPLLRTITLARDGRPLVRLHYYATHPQTFCCDGRASADVVGLAREGMQNREHVFQIYFTGCAGDVTVGKYNDGTKEALAGLVERLENAMEASAAATQFRPATNLVWRTASVVFPLRTNRDSLVSESRGWLSSPRETDYHRVYEGAMRLAFVERSATPVGLSSLQLEHVHILNLPGEPMLAFQLYAQKLASAAFVAVAGYGDCGPAYICTDKALKEGGYEPGATNVGPGSEDILKRAVRDLLGD